MKKVVIISTAIIIIAALCSLYYFSHSTYYKYNDWWIVGRTVDEVKKRYGEFDLIWGSSMAGYYIYHDSGPIMPDHLDHYYYMEYDGNGIVYNVYDGAQLGG